MKVRYQIIVEITADGMMGPLRVQDLVRNALTLSPAIALAPPGQELELGKVRIAAVYTLAPDDKVVVVRVPGTDQSRPVEEIRDPRVT